MTSTRKVRKSLNDTAHAIDGAIDTAIHRTPRKRHVLRAIRRTTTRIVAVSAAAAVVRRVVARRRAPSEAAHAHSSPATGVAEWPPLVERDAEPATDVAPWVDPVDGVCPLTHPVKGNAASQIYHVPGSRFYDKTSPERCYRDAAAAEADGMRAPKR